MLRELSVHHSGTDGLLFSLDEEGKGYGKLNAARCGGDQLAKRMLELLPSRIAKVPVTPGLRRDDVGYLPLAVDITHLYPHLLGLPAPVLKVVGRQYRKAVLFPFIGDVVEARVTKATARGTALTVVNPLGGGASANVAALAAFEQPEEDDTSDVVAATVLDYDAVTGALTVTLKTEVARGIGRGVADGSRFEGTFAYCAAGDVLQCTVLLSANDDGVAVVAVKVPRTARRNAPAACCASGACESGEHSQALSGVATIIGYLADPNIRDAKEKAEVTPIGTVLEAVVEFAPACEAAARHCPFLVLSRDTRRVTGLTTPAVLRDLVERTRVNGRDVGLVGVFPWRSTESGRKKDRDGEDGDEHVRRRRLEEAIDAYERQTNVLPTSVDDFTKLLIASPNSSYLWTQFMAFHVGLQQVEEARQVAEKALRTIGHRESKELRNVWIAYMNIENLHGTAESLTSVFRRACQHSDDTLTLHERLADVFHSTKKHQQELAICRTMVGRYRDEARVWERLGCCLLDQDRRDQLKRMLKDMSGNTSVLPKSDQLLVAEHLAIHEYRNARIDSGRALFEGLILKAPKRSDIWQAYLDQETGLLTRKDPAGSVASTRQIFDRLATIQLAPKVMQQILTRFLTFEQTHGTPADVEKVKTKARDYVSNRIAASAGSAPSGTV